MVMPCSQNEVSIFRNHAHNTRKFSRIEAIALGNRDLGLQPNLGVTTTAFDVDVWSFARLALVGEEKVS
jgi:hypothetical protein